MDLGVSEPEMKISYLRSRDPSILSWNRYGLDKARVNLHFSSEESAFTATPPQNEEKRVDVFLRIKGGVECSDIYTIEENTLICKLPDSTCNNKSSSHAEKYTFTRIFNSYRTQEDIFNHTVKEKILRFINGENSTLMAYGSSGSGKTFTLIGTSEEPGIIPRSLKYMFHSLPLLDEYPKAKPLPNGKAVILDDTQKMTEKHILLSILKDANGSKERATHAKAYSTMQQRLSLDPVAIVENVTPILNIWVSLAEIYNEQIFDLLQPVTKGQQRPRLKIGRLQDNIYIKDLRSVYVRSGLEAYEILQYGLQNRNRAATAVNLQSSRSHCIFTIKLVQGYDAENIIVSCFNFSDLAGSERLKKTLNEGSRLKESNMINNSLMVLGRCISMVMDGQYKKENTVPPFRESKLTQLFQRALLGKEDIQLMVNINPSKDMFSETQHTLNFSATAKEVIIDQVPVKVLNSSRFLGSKDSDDRDDEREEEFRELRNQIADLVLQISELKDDLLDERFKFSELQDTLYEERLEREEAIDKEREHIIKNYTEIVKLKDRQIEKLKQENKTLIAENRELKKEMQDMLLGNKSSDDSDIIFNGNNSGGDSICEPEQSVLTDNP